MAPFDVIGVGINAVDVLLRIPSNMSVGEKHRYGSKEHFAWFQHNDNGVKQWSLRFHKNEKCKRCVAIVL